MSSDETKPQPAIVAQAASYLTYVHANHVDVSPETKLIANENLREIVRLFDPAAGRFGYLPSERHYPDVFLVDTLCRFSGMTTCSDGALSVSQHGYFYLSREPERRLIMLAAAYVNDYPWSMLFPRGDLGHQIMRRRGEAIELILSLKPGSAIQLEEFSQTLAERLEIALSNKNPPYPSLILEWVVRHILIKPLSRLAVLRILDADGAVVDDIKEGRSIELTEGGKSLLTLREVKYAGVQ